MVNAVDILKHKLVGSLEEKYFKGKFQSYINYPNCTLTGLVHNIYGDHEIISPIDMD